MILLDTHVWIWWVSNPELLSSQADTLINKSMVERKIYISSISVWEVAMLVVKRRLQLTLDVKDWIRSCEALPFIQFIPVSNAIASEAVFLPEKPLSDPADRIIVATARALDLILITKDKTIQRAKQVKTAW
ncbi:MAG: type II toxin-antitoxin system VapC family toxin [Deltaproteobacteria bacterium]|nr:type II toxin-antitoxin system VapC family toxin [Deltaproteobacteria bacterium]